MSFIFFLTSNHILSGVMYSPLVTAAHQGPFHPVGIHFFDNDLTYCMYLLLYLCACVLVCVCVCVCARAGRAVGVCVWVCVCVRERLTSPSEGRRGRRGVALGVSLGLESLGETGASGREPWGTAGGLGGGRDGGF